MRPMKTVQVFARNSQGQVVLQQMKWGLIPASFTGHVSDWMASTFHARLETVATTRSFLSGWQKKRRVIFPMERYFEKVNAGADLLGKKAGLKRVAIKRADEKPLGVAGIYDYAKTLDGPILSVATLTRSPGPRMSLIHDREPVVWSRKTGKPGLKVTRRSAQRGRGPTMPFKWRLRPEPNRSRLGPVRG